MTHQEEGWGSHRHPAVSVQRGSGVAPRRVEKGIQRKVAVVAEGLAVAFLVLDATQEILHVGWAVYLAHDAVHHGRAIHACRHFAADHRLGEEGEVALVNRYGGEKNGFLSFMSGYEITWLTAPL